MHILLDYIQSITCLLALLIGFWQWQRLDVVGRLIVGTLLINVVADLLSISIQGRFGNTAMIYNVTIRALHLLTYWIYQRISTQPWLRMTNWVIIGIVIVSFSLELILRNDYSRLWVSAYLILALAMVLMSYVNLRFYLLSALEARPLLVIFMLATFLFYAVSFSTVSSWGTLISENAPMSRGIWEIVHFAYMGWSALIAIGLLWRKG